MPKAGNGNQRQRGGRPRAPGAFATRAAAGGVTLCAALVVTPLALAATVGGQVDTFDGDTTLGWSHGVGSPTPPIVVQDGGPAGDGDGFLLVRSTGSPSGPGSALVTFNASQWAGAYLGLGSIEADLRNHGSSALYMRVGIVSGSSATVYVSTAAVELAVDSGWTRAAFMLDADRFSRLTGAAPFLDALANTTELRLLSAQIVTSASGDRVLGAFGVDNVTAVPAVPLPPTVWLLTSGSVLVARVAVRARSSVARS